MVIILCSVPDSSARQVAEWINYAGEQVYLLNSEYFSEELKSITLGSPSVMLFNNFDAKTVKSIWFRRDFHLNQSVKVKSRTLQNVQITEYLIEELKVLKEAVFSELSKEKKKLGMYPIRNMNKLQVLLQAQTVGLDIPATFVTTQKPDLAKHAGKLITKPIAETTTFRNHKTHDILGIYTESINQEVLDNTNDVFFPSLFQYKIEKEYEIRVFFLGGKCYSMAIFSQNDDQTSVDFRRYNTRKGNRNIPYQLPTDIEEKLAKLMAKLNLDTGSIDFVKATDGKYIFLEINPVGQFGMVDRPCNYYLHKKIAEYLTK